MAAYSQKTFAEAKTILAGLLDDYNKVFFTDAELGRYIVEALRTWNSAAQYWRERAAFSTIASQSFYDLGTVLTPSLIPRSVTASELISDVCYALMETPPTGETWNGTDKFTTADVESAIARARDDFLYSTSCVTYEIPQVTITPPPDGRITLTNQNISDIRRLDWLSIEDNLYHHLWREDEWGFNTTRIRWNTDAGMPEAYSIVSVHPLQIQIAPIANNSATMSLIVVQAGADVLDDATAIDVPVDFAWVIKWGALNILLGRDGQVRDPERANYCAQRWEEGLALAKKAASVIQGQVNGLPVQVDGVVDLDSTRPGWRNETATPDSLALASWNLLAIAGGKNGGDSVVVDVVRNAVVPSADGDFIDIGREYFDSVMGYAQHLAAFKMGGVEHQETLPQLKDFYEMAMAHNAELRANSAFYDLIQMRSQREMMQNPAKANMQEAQ